MKPRQESGLDFNSRPVARDDQKLWWTTKKIVGWSSIRQPKFMQQVNRLLLGLLQISLWTTKFSFAQPKKADRFSKGQP